MAEQAQNNEDISKPEPRYKKVHVIVNPASGQDKPILGAMNTCFRDAGIEWELLLTKDSGDAERLAKEAVAAGVDAVAVYGGDGTVMEVASGLVNSKVPLAILPGGTANVTSVELGIPNDLSAALSLLCGTDSEERTIDMGHVENRKFLLRIGIGFEATMMNKADRETKNRIGVLAYVISGLQALTERTISHYTINVDGEIHEVDGLSCMIANSGNLGLPNVKLSQTVQVGDGLLDVIVIPNVDLGGLLSVAANTTGGDQLPRWKGKRIEVTANPPQPVISDGEPIDDTPVIAEVIPQCLIVLVPREAAAAAAAAEAQAMADDAKLTSTAGLAAT